MTEIIDKKKEIRKKIKNYKQKIKLEKSPHQRDLIRRNIRVLINNLKILEREIKNNGQ